MNVFRIGLNLLVLLTLGNIERFSNAATFTLCVVLLGLAT